MSNEIPPEAGYFIKFWQEILGGVIIILVGWYVKATGKREPIYLTKEAVERDMLACRRDVMNEFRQELDRRDEKLLEHIRDLLK